ncbi:MAG TPA: extracellular solute-binding protein [Thermomicrobiales bacterium]|nr:extracellular solute-binding protein [Thermomicrobiales bacterium]
MMRNSGPRINRRRLMGGAAGGGAAFALGGARIPEIVAAKKAPAVIQGSTKFTYWGGLIFSEEANNMLVEEIQAWGEENGLDAEVVMINQNETNQKVSAAVESNTMPDALDMGLDLLLLLSQTGQLMDLSETFDKIGEAHGGWFASVANATDPAKFQGARTGVPFGSSGNVLFRRTDILSEAGFTEAPETWQELSDQAREAQAPPVFGMGFALSNVGDANQQISVMQSYGGRIANDEGTEATIKSEDTRDYLEWVTTAYNDGLFPPGATTWDGAGDNTAYLSGQAIFIANTGSVTLAMNEDDPELAEATGYTALPAGPVMQVSPTNPNVRAVPASSSNPDAAKTLIEHLANPEFMEAYYNVAIYGPVLQDQQSFPVFAGPVHGGLLDLVKSGTAPAEPDVFNAAYAEVSSTFLIPKMVQRVVVDGYTLDEAMDEAQQAAEAIYAKYR